MGLTSAANRTATYNTGDYKGGMILSHDPEISHVPPEFITVNDVSTLKRICGINNELFTVDGLANTHDLPPDIQDLAAPVTNPLDLNLCKAMSAYIFGNSQDVKGWEETINTLRFPIKITCFTANVINVQNGTPLLLKGSDANPIAVFPDFINIEPGAQIITEGPGKISSTQMNLHTSDETNLGGAGESVTNLLSIGGNGGPGGPGGHGANNANGAKGADATKSGKSGCNAAGNGGSGVDGGNATDGGQGGNGGDGSEINYSVTTMTGTYVVGSIGGNGGDSGRGGDGGKGGDGGPGGSGCRDCGTGLQGDAGNGGKAGSGPDGGPAGNGSKVYINYTSGNPVISTPNPPLKANGGSGGGAGTPGSAGTGSNSPHSGAVGTAGVGGKGGSPGTIIINGVVQK